MNATLSPNHAGLLIPLDMFRLSQIAALFADLLVSKARNILDAKLVVSRHPSSPILLLKINGHVVGDDEAAFWRENADLVGLASQALPRQVFMYYAEPGPPATRREGFVVAQRGQVLAADDATHDRLPAEATEADWPVTRLCQQMRITVDELANGFPGGPRVEISLVEPTVDDQALLMVLLEGQPGTPGDEPSSATATAPADGAAGPAGERAAVRPEMNAAEDLKRRAKEGAAEAAAQRERAEQVVADLPCVVDDLGAVVAPAVEMAEAEILAPFIVSKVDGDLPVGLARELTRSLQGRRVDVVVRVEFLSEVFRESAPLSRPVFEEHAAATELGGRALRQLEVLGPRLGNGTLISTGTKHVFISRRVGMPIPAELVLPLLEE